MALELWAVRMDRLLTGWETERILPLLPSERQKRLLALRQEEKRTGPLLAYLLLRQALRERYGWQELPAIYRTETGKPWFPDFPSVHFNLSHTDGAVLVAVSESPVGVDIEKIRPLRWLQTGEPPDTAGESGFFQDWVRREARVKLRGAGIGSMLRTEPPLAEGERFYPLETFPGYAAGTATAAAEPPGPMRKYTRAVLTDGLLTFME